MKLNLEKINKKNISFMGLMGSGKTIIGKLLSRKKVNDKIIHEESISSNNSFTRLNGPFGIDYSTLKAKGTLQ